MCGILIASGIEEPDFIRALSKLSHRGPYNIGHVSIDGILVGMTQLPMKSQKKDIIPVSYENYIASYNGEIYEDFTDDLYKEVRVAVESIVNHRAINGMFSIGIYNQLKKEILIARDESGIKPIYYYLNKEQRQFIAASEILPILELVGQVKINKKVISEIAIIGTQFSEETCFSGIYLLDPGLILKLNINDFSLSKEYLPSLVPESDDLELLLNRSVNACQSTFRENSLLLSEGLDSNLILTYLPDNVSKYNINIDGSNSINSIANKNLRQCFLENSNYDSLLEKAISSYGQPCRMTSILMYQALSDYIKSNDCNMVIMGEGADELFWGYPRHKLLHDNHLKNIELKDIFFEKSFNSTDLLLSKDLILMLNDEIDQIIMENYKDNIEGAIYFLDKKFSMEPLLRRADHILMQNTIEARIPFLHFGIPELARNPSLTKVNKEYTKFPLVQLMKKRNPNFLIKEKQHFRAPLNDWLKSKSFDQHFNEQQQEIISCLGFSVNKLKEYFDLNIGPTIFTFKTMVIWYEKYKKYLYV